MRIPHIFSILWDFLNSGFETPGNHRGYHIIHISIIIYHTTGEYILLTEVVLSFYLFIYCKHPKPVVSTGVDMTESKTPKKQRKSDAYYRTVLLLIGVGVFSTLLLINLVILGLKYRYPPKKGKYG